MKRIVLCTNEYQIVVGLVEHNLRVVLINNWKQECDLTRIGTTKKYRNHVWTTSGIYLRITKLSKCYGQRWTKNAIYEQFPNVFKQEVGCIPNVQYTLKLKGGTTPVYRPSPCPVTYALKSKVDLELDTLEK